MAHGIRHPKDNAPQNLTLLTKIVLNLIRLNATDKAKASLRLKGKRAAWDDNARLGIFGVTSLWPTSAGALHHRSVDRCWQGSTYPRAFFVYPRAFALEPSGATSDLNCP